MAGVRLVGIDCHIGSQIAQSGPIEEAVERMLDNRSDPDAWRQAQRDAREALHVHTENEAWVR